MPENMNETNQAMLFDAIQMALHPQKRLEIGLMAKLKSQKLSTIEH